MGQRRYTTATVNRKYSNANSKVNINWNDVISDPNLGVSSFTLVQRGSFEMIPGHLSDVFPREP